MKRRPFFDNKTRFIFFFIVAGSLLYLLFSVAPVFLAWGQHLSAAWMCQAGFRVRTILVEGRQRTPRTVLLKALNIHRGSCMFFFDPQSLKTKIQALPWVRSAVVERQLPYTIYIRLAEVYPVALWKNKEQSRLIVSNGQHIPWNPAEFSTPLITIIGDQAPQKTPALLATLGKFPSLKRRVIAAALLRCGRWDLQLEHHVTVRLPELQVEQALKQLLLFEKRYPDIFATVETFDLRIPSSFVLRFKKKAEVIYPTKIGGISYPTYRKSA